MKRLFSTLAVVALTAGSLPLAAPAQSTPTITVNGTQATFDQPPIERAGRIYVPLRGVFEQLGASVVFANGQINATRGSTTVALTIGNTTATVNGQQQQLDSPPFVIGARTLVPLRFVAQALGATVSFDANTNSVAIMQAMPNVVITPVPRPPAPPPIPPPPAGPVSLPLVRPEPPNGSSIDGPHPEIAATFPTAIRPDDLRIRLDGRDIASASYVSDRNFSFDPSFDLPFGVHRVEIDGRLADGRRFVAGWQFENHAAVAPNYLRGIAPHNGDRVGFVFTVSGVTRPGSLVRIVATSSDRLPFGATEQTTSNGDVTAAPDGTFARNIALDDRGGSIIDVRISSRAPDGATAVAVIHLRP
jgi:hypothetical protein